MQYVAAAANVLALDVQSQFTQYLVISSLEVLSVVTHQFVGCYGVVR